MSAHFFSSSSSRCRSALNNSGHACFHGKFVFFILVTLTLCVTTRGFRCVAATRARHANVLGCGLNRITALILFHHPYTIPLGADMLIFARQNGGYFDQCLRSTCGIHMWRILLVLQMSYVFGMGFPIIIFWFLSHFGLLFIFIILIRWIL